MADMKDLLEYMSKSIVNDPDSVVVEERRRGRNITYYLSVAPNDMGRVIGKKGRMANAMRVLLKVGAVKAGKHVSLEIGK
jgi:hypothetical protein